MRNWGEAVAETPNEAFNVGSGSCVTRIAGPNGDAQQTQGVNVSTGPAAFLPR